MAVNIEHAMTEFREMDDLAAMKSPVHDLHPLVKLIMTIVYIFITVSFDKYDLSGVIIMVFYPVLMFEISGIPIKTCFYKLRVVLPLVCAVGLFNPFFDRTVVMQLGRVPITSGVISMVTLMLKGIFSLMASFILVATTSMDQICGALRKLHVPGILVTLLLLTYRYISVMMEEVSIMTTAYKLRAPGQKGIHYKAWGSFLGQLLLRSMDRAEELYSSMQLRGFAGEFRYAEGRALRARDLIVMVLVILVLVFFRWCNVAQLLGTIVM